MDVILFAIAAIRAIVEMLLLCLIAHACLYLIAGKKYRSNLIYQLFALVTRGPRHVVASFLPDRLTPSVVGAVTFALLGIIWIGLAFLRKTI